ncbi:MAG: Gfo/Idh/MocA family oxidoreductase [Desulfobacterales bacterium]|nr:Gfo/Idh/MocA family oxidoreductase [Desulfobacterales bacterium]
METKLKIGIVGCGKQAEKHIECIKKIPKVEVVISDLNLEMAKSLSGKTGVAWAANTGDIFSDASTRAVVICTPTPTHVDLIEAAVRAGKDVLCEKPFCEYKTDNSRLEALADERDRIVMVGYVYRFVPIFEEGHQLIARQLVNGESITLGRVLSAYFRLGGRGGHQKWKHIKDMGGGAINEMLVHMVDLASWYFGPLEKIDVISCDLRYPTRLINGEEIKCDAEDFILMRCFGRNGIEVHCQADLITPAFTQYVEIQGENGTFMGSIQPDMPSFIFLKEGRGGYSSGKTEIKFGRRNVLDLQMISFVQAVINREAPDRNTVRDSLELNSVMAEIRTQTG